MGEQNQADPGAARLMSVLVEKGALSPEWIPAFHGVPRHMFLPDAIWPGTADGNRQKRRIIRSEDPDGWWTAVHTDAPITTQWDDGAYTGPGRGKVPSCSSSMPTMVFSMLAALDARDGDEVLEIGTGTGWNAGLLCHRVGAGNVVTVEVDGTNAADAGKRLALAGYAPVTVMGDGAHGYPRRAPYDRLIATCSVGHVPYTWVEQTRPGGVIVAPWGPVYGGEAIVRLVVRTDGTASGEFLGSSAFMRLRSQRTERKHIRDYLKGEPWPAGGVMSTTRLSPDEVGDWHVMFAVGAQIPEAFPWMESYDDGSYTLWLRDTAVTSWATVDFEKGRSVFEVVQSGPRKLWDEVERAYFWWDARRRPGFERFGLTVTADRETLWLDDPGNPVPRIAW